MPPQKLINILETSLARRTSQRGNKIRTAKTLNHCFRGSVKLPPSKSFRLSVLVKTVNHGNSRLKIRTNRRKSVSICLKIRRPSLKKNGKSARKT